MTKNTFLKKNGIYLIICICILLIVMVCFISNNRHEPYTIRSEGFNVFDLIKDTDYLEPVKEIITDDLWSILNNKMKT